MNMKTNSSAFLASSILVAATLGVMATTAPPARAAPAVEVQVTTSSFVDIEFDWGRDGVYCATCNFGASNARFQWVDRANHLWVAGIDDQTGSFYPPDGHGVLVDTLAAFWSDFGDGPEWSYSQASGSQLVYTRYAPGQPKTPANAGIAVAQMVNGAWSASFVQGGAGRVTPIASLYGGDKVARMAYINVNGTQVYWRKVGYQTAETSLATGNQQGKLMFARWVSPATGTGTGSNQLIMVGSAPPDASGVVYKQVFLYYVDTGVEEQLTFDATQKNVAFMLPVPEFGGEMMFFTTANQTQLNIYRKLADANGVLRWTVVKSVTAPDSSPYMASPEPFVHNGQTWIFIQLTRSPIPGSITFPTSLALTGIDPAQNNFRMLTDWTSPSRLRLDPEYYITANGPYLYYSRSIPGIQGGQPTPEGTWRVDMGLGPPRKSAPTP
jgi:hypothetical protein